MFMDIMREFGQEVRLRQLYIKDVGHALVDYMDDDWVTIDITFGGLDLPIPGSEWREWEDPIIHIDGEAV